ncbi:hypothetical protein F2P56_034337, partial [Juglans regia]
MALSHKSIFEDATSPLFLHVSNSLGVLLVTQPLVGDNYHAWSRSMFMELSAKNKLGFVNGSLTMPSESTYPLLSSWLRCNNMDLTRWRLIGVGRLQGLYILQQSCSSFSKPTSYTPCLLDNMSLHACSVSSKRSKYELWHNRLGHPSNSRIIFVNKFVPHLIVRCNPCMVCPFVKQRKLHFPNNVHLFAAPFDLVHYDIWRPCSVPTVDGYRYFFTIVDDSTHATWLCLLKHKYEVSHVFKVFFFF